MRQVTRCPIKAQLTAGLLLLTLVGCATITGGTKDQKVKIASNPPGAAVFVDGQPQGVTPAVVTVSRKTEHHVDVSAPGCETAHVMLERHLNPWVFGNLLCGGLIGVTVDLCTDATHCVGPSEVLVNLRSTGVPAPYQGLAPGPIVPTSAFGPPGNGGVVPAGGSLPPP